MFSMWKLLYQLASPKSFYHMSDRILRVIAIPQYVLLIAGLFAGLFFSPQDYQQGNMVRLIYLHVPTAFLSVMLYSCMAFCAVLLLVWRIKLAGIFLISIARIGAIMTILALITGAIWGKPMWGTWWIWDARLTSELILFFLYLAILTLNSSFEHKQNADKIIAIVTLVGLIDLPIIHFSVYWWNTLHQGATLTLFAKPKIHSSMLYPLLLVLVGLGLYCFSTILMRTRQELLWRERKQHWVKELLVNVS